MPLHAPTRTLLVAAALTAPLLAAMGDSADGGAPRLVPVLEPGKPMRMQVVVDPAATTVQTTAADGGFTVCAINAPLDRTATPSSTCMRCHDGSKALDARGGHKYDIEYAYSVRPGGDLRPDPMQFNSKVVLAAGTITCVTCHDPASTAPYHLAAPTSGDVSKRLCVACHIH